ncbi:MAG: tetratricopeptide repeat protein [Acidobacteriota bacterium]
MTNSSDGPSPEEHRQTYRLADVRALYPLVTEEHFRTLEKCNLVRPAAGATGDRLVSFSDLLLVRQVQSELQRGAPFKAVMRSLLASKAGQLALDFRMDTQPAKVVRLQQSRSSALPRSQARTSKRDAGQAGGEHAALAEQYFILASRLDDGSAANQTQAAQNYRRALEIDPSLVPALINLANLHYLWDQLVEALALYDRAISVEPDVFEAHFNLGNIHHDLGRYDEAEACYRRALAINEGYPEAHLYLAVALEKAGRPEVAKPHWGRYRQLAPGGEWAELAREFSEG